MTVATTVNYVRTTANGAITAFDFTFPVFSSSEIEVYTIVRSTGVETLKTLTTHYTVSLNSSSPGGTITFLSAPAATLDVYIRRVVPYTQTADIPSGGNFPEEQIENQLDRLVMMIQQLAEEVGRAFTVSIGSNVSVLTLPTPEDGKILAWDGTDGAMQNIDDPTDAAATSATAAAASAAAAVTSAQAAASWAVTSYTHATNAAASAAAAAASAASITGVAFTVSKSIAQSVNNGSAAKITWDTEGIDTGNYFASDKFTPGTAGKYLFIFRGSFGGLADAKFVTFDIRKNGSVVASVTLYSSAASSTVGEEVSVLLDMNGSTDYVETYAEQGDTTARNFGGTTTTAFMGCKVA